MGIGYYNVPMVVEVDFGQLWIMPEYPWLPDLSVDDVL